MTAPLGIIGIGEAGAAIAHGLRREHDIEVLGFDVRANQVEVRDRARRSGLRLVTDLGQLADSAETLVCLTSAKVALSAAESVAPHLRARHCYSDWNSASPQLMEEISAVIAPTGATFVDGAVMSAVPPHEHRVPVLLSGDGATEMAAGLDWLGMRLEVIGQQPGQASAVKMFRSLLVKGLEALLLECTVGAHAYGATSHVLASMNGSLPTDDWQELASYLLERTMAHGERRAEELRQVASTLDGLGIEPLLASAGAHRLQWFVDLEVDKTDGASGYADVLGRIEKARY